MSDTPTELDLLLRESPEADEGDEEAPRRRRRSSWKEREIRELNLTAMMDMMTIILVFLLSNYGVAPENVTVSDTLKPPESTVKDRLEGAVAVVITEQGLIVDSKLVTPMHPDGTLVGEEAGQPSNDVSIPSLAEALEKKVADANALAERGGSPFEGKLLIVADQTTPYSMLMRVLYTAGVAKFSQYKLVVRAAPDAGSGAH